MPRIQLNGASRGVESLDTGGGRVSDGPGEGAGATRLRSNPAGGTLEPRTRPASATPPTGHSAPAPACDGTYLDQTASTLDGLTARGAWREKVPGRIGFRHMPQASTRHFEG